VGDTHAAQGDGELCGVAIEHHPVTTVQVDLINGWTFKRARWRWHMPAPRWALYPASRASCWRRQC
jgi:acetamidase/formamidase